MKTAGPEVLLAAELRLSEFLLHASRRAEDPRDSIRLRKVALECREYSRTLARHFRLGGGGRSADDLRPRGRVDPRDSLRTARDLARLLFRRFRREGARIRDPWFALFLRILTGEHDRIARDLDRLEETWAGDTAEAVDRHRGKDRSAASHT